MAPTDSGPPLNLPWRKHFGLKCTTCGQASVVEVGGLQVEACMRDPVAGLRTLAADQQAELAVFSAKHAAMGHIATPFVAELAPMPRS